MWILHLLPLLCVMFLSDVGRTAKTAYLGLQETDLFTSSSCHLKSRLRAAVRTENIILTLHLTKNDDAGRNAAGFVPRRGEDGQVKIVKDTVLDFQTSAEYQDRRYLASITVSCKAISTSTCKYYVNGELSLPDGKQYTIKYVSRMKRNALPSLPGDVYELEPTQPLDIGLQAAGVDVTDNDDPSPSPSQLRDDFKRLTKPLLQPINIDVVTLVDYTVYRRWHDRSKMETESLKIADTKQQIRRHFAHILNAINLRFKTASEMYNFRLIGYIIEDQESGEWLTNVVEEENLVNKTQLDALMLLESLSNWTRTTEDFPQSDHLLTWTRHDLYWTRGGNDNDLYGIAYVGQLCRDQHNSLSVVEYRDLTDDILVATHEIGHSFGAQHDGEHGNPCLRNQSYIMATDYGGFHSLDHNNQYLFSLCSMAYFRNHVDTLLTDGSEYSKSCLLDTLRTEFVTNISGEMPGQLYDPDTQCRMAYGEESYFCRVRTDIVTIQDRIRYIPPVWIKYTDSILKPTNMTYICKRLYCLNPRDNLCYPIIAAEGTSCGNKKWCVAGECVYSDIAPTGNGKCIAGDFPGYIYKNQTCEEFLQPIFPYLCYNELVSVWCCGTCLEYAKNDPDCEYGDKMETSCDINQCQARNGTEYVYNCCDTCREYRTTTTSTTTTTTTTAADTSVCYNTTVEDRCCVSCRNRHTGIIGCEYGDRNPLFCKAKSGTSCCDDGKVCCATCKTGDVCSRGQRRTQTVFKLFFPLLLEYLYTLLH